MFDRDSGRGILLSGMIRNHGIAQANARAAEDADATARRNYDVAVRAQSRVRELEAEVAQLEFELALEQSELSGSKAVLEAFKRAHPDSPLNVRTGTLSNGTQKRRSMDIFIAAFDAAAKARGIARPEDHRVS